KPRKLGHGSCPRNQGAPARGASVFDCHRVGIDCFFTGDALECSEYSSVVVLIALRDEASLLVAVGPGGSNEVFFGLGESAPIPKETTGYTNGSANSAMDILSIADLGYR